MGSKQKSEKLAVVTGASSGIGYELASVFAEEGYDLIIAAEDQDIYEAADSLREKGHRVHAVQVNLARFEGVEELYFQIKSMQRIPDCVALNAGVGVSGAFLTTDLDLELDMIQLNVMSTVHLAKRILPDLVERGEGRLLFTSSVAAEMPGPYYAIYAATKSFIQSFAEALREELKDSGVSVTALQPGATETEFFERAGMQDTKAGQAQKDDPALVARQGYEAMMANKDHVVAGSLLNKLQVVVAKYMSESMGARMQGSQTRPLHSPENH